MKKLILLGVVAIVAMFSSPAEAQISVNVNIGSRPQYVPVRYVSRGYYYGVPNRPVYINNNYKVKHYKNYKWKPAKVRYVSRPVVYQRGYYTNDRGRGHGQYKQKHHKHDRGIERIVGSRGRR